MHCVLVSCCLEHHRNATPGGNIVEVGHDESPEDGHSSLLVEVSYKGRSVGMHPCDTIHSGSLSSINQAVSQKWQFVQKCSFMYSRPVKACDVIELCSWTYIPGN